MADDISKAVADVEAAKAAVVASTDFYGAGGKAKHPFIVPNPGVKVNGELWLGRMELTYTQRETAESLLANRRSHELKARLGEADAVKIMDMGGSGGSREWF